jgi:hypothetical protein
MEKRKYDKAHGRDYSYDTEYQSSERQKERRARRNRDRRRALAAGKVHKNDGKDVHHRGSKDLISPVIISSSKNRAMK